MPSGAGHRGMLLDRRALIAVYLAFGALASFRRRHQGSVFAIGREHTMEACQIGSRSGDQGCQACDKVQWFEDDVGSTVAVRCFQLVADVAARCQRQASFRYCRATDVSSGPPSDRRSSFLRSSALADTPACRENPDTLPAESA